MHDASTGPAEGHAASERQMQSKMSIEQANAGTANLDDLTGCDMEIQTFCVAGLESPEAFPDQPTRIQILMASSRSARVAASARGA